MKGNASGMYFVEITANWGINLPSGKQVEAKKVYIYIYDFVQLGYVITPHKCHQK